MLVFIILDKTFSLQTTTTVQSVRDSYKTLIAEFKRVEESTQTLSGSTSPVEGSLLAELCRHLCQFVQARQELIDLYPYGNTTLNT